MATTKKGTAKRDAKKPRTAKPRTCSARGCNERVHAKGLCPVHYRAARTKARDAAKA
jgi:hypothetical protein